MCVLMTSSLINCGLNEEKSVFELPLVSAMRISLRTAVVTLIACL